MTSEENITITKAEYETLLKYKDEVSYLSLQLAELKRLIFGSKRERFISTNDPQQGSLFEVPEVEAVEKKAEEITYTRTKPQPKGQPLRTELPAHLPRRERVIEPDTIPEGAKKIGEVVTEILHITPGEFYVEKIIRPKFVVESTDEHTSIIIAEMPKMPIPKGNAGASLLAWILISKFFDHLPFYRQQQIFKRMGVVIAESTINGWFTAACRLLVPLYEALRAKVLLSSYLMSDETPLRVLTRDKPGTTHRGFHWAYCAPVERLALFDYQKSRSREGPQQLLTSFQGHLQTDGYEVYNYFENQPGITLLACMAHARRYFDKAKDNDPQRAEKALKMFQNLYAIESIAREEKLQPDQIRILRQEKAVPVLQEMEAWLKKNAYEVLPKSAIGKAIAYTLNLWPRLLRYVEDGRFHIDNNMIENTIRPIALGRKNYLFAGSHDAAQRAAMVYSFMATCKLNNIEPLEWFTDILTKLPITSPDQLHTLLPGQ